ncbi:MAG: histidine kinase [Methylococcales bacterium]
MNLKFYLLSRIMVIAVLCLLGTALYLLYQVDQASRHSATITAESLVKQLEVQRLRIDAGFGQEQRFPDFELWKQTSNTSGVCVRYVSIDHKLTHSICNGSVTDSGPVPSWFQQLYLQLFNAEIKILRNVMFNHQFYGSIQVEPIIDVQITNAWQSMQGLMSYAVSSTLALCVLIIFSINRALRPAQTIVTGLEKLKDGELWLRLPAFELDEWQRTGAAINALAASQEQLLNERQRLVLKLLNLQEQERRYLARELHDEFGQCLTAINALAASITQTAATDCPVLVAESQQISKITNQLLALLRGLLLRIRPTDLDELGLNAGLQQLVNTSMSGSQGKIVIQLKVSAALNQLPEPTSLTIFRITQEALTNIVKHSGASYAQVIVNNAANAAQSGIQLVIEDDGITRQLPFTNHDGIGLIGMRERVTALGGKLTLKTAQPSGLIIDVWLPTAGETGINA